MSPAREVGGDFYDFFLVDPDRLGFVIGDVSGKGIPAAIFMAVCRTLLKATALQGGTAGECIKYVNDTLTRQSDSAMFVTIFYGILHTDTGELEYCIAGHNPPYVLPATGEPFRLSEPAGLMAGAFEHAVFQTGRLTLGPGDGVFLYTDGVTESEDATGQFFGEQRLANLLARMPGATAEELTGSVLDEVRLHALGSTVSDDITALVLKYKG
jgi:sigma-B regulation protein RsbU (phosphoserine phosphatase)